MEKIRYRGPHPKRAFPKRTCFVIFILIIAFFTFYPKIYLSNETITLSPNSEPMLRFLADESPSPTDNNQIHNNWIVVTSINYPTEQIKKLSQIPNWQLLVVADMKTPVDWAFPNTIVLDTDTQLNLGYRVLRLLPWNSYTRKVIGYLYAIQHGAEFIYDTDDDNAPDDIEAFEQSLVLNRTTFGLVLANHSDVVANPYIHFGQPSVWPRGYPLDKIAHNYNNTYTVCQMRTPLIQQGLVNGDPDVDAIFRLTRKTLHSPLNIQFDNVAPPLILPHRILAPFNSQNTVFHYDAFWALLLPVTVEFRVTDIWRGYWAQPLLRKIGGHLGFYPPFITQIRSPHVYLKDFEGEGKLYKQASDLAHLLAEWECDAQDLYTCMMDLSSTMANHSMWSSGELMLVEAWISDLKSIGYQVPSLSANQSSTPCLRNGSETNALFYGVETQSRAMYSKEFNEYRIPLREFCNFTVAASPQEINNTDSQTVSDPIVFPSTLLIIVFNFPHYDNIWLLDSIFRPHYPNIVYCGGYADADILNNLIKTESFIGAKVNKFSFVNANVTKGYFAYECAIRAIEMKYSVEGYLVVGDDILLNFWNNGKYNPNEIWMQGKPNHYLTIDNPNSSWAWWRDPFGIDATKCALTGIYDPSLEINQNIIQFRTDREKYGLNSSTVPYSESDLFYFPKSKQDALYEVASILRKCEVFLEIGVPILGTGLSSPTSMVELPGVGVWGSNRGEPFKFFNESSSFFHPVKLSQVMSDERLKGEYCSNYIARVLLCRSTAD